MECCLRPQQRAVVKILQQHGINASRSRTVLPKSSTAVDLGLDTVLLAEAWAVNNTIK